MLSLYQLEVMKKLDINKDNTKKLICDLTDKNNYVIHYRYLKLCLELGMKLTIYFSRFSLCITFMTSISLSQ